MKFKKGFLVDPSKFMTDRKLSLCLICHQNLGSVNGMLINVMLIKNLLKTFTIKIKVSLPMINVRARDDSD